jgi:hypothetical protein
VVVDPVAFYLENGQTTTAANVLYAISAELADMWEGLGGSASREEPAA